MKLKGLFPLLLTLVLAFAGLSCKKCDNRCFNGGACFESACECSYWFYGPECRDTTSRRLVGHFTFNGTCQDTLVVIDSVYLAKSNSACCVNMKSLYGFEETELLVSMDSSRVEFTIKNGSYAGKTVTGTGVSNDAYNSIQLEYEIVSPANDTFRYVGVLTRN